jgi:hypothetical protein
MTGSRTGQKTKNRRTPEEHFCSFLTARIYSPDPFGSLALRSVFRPDRFIIKGHSLSGSMLSVTGPDDTRTELKRR